MNKYIINLHDANESSELTSLIIDKESKDLLDAEVNKQKPFIQSLMKFFEENGYLTKRQKECLKNPKEFPSNKNNRAAKREDQLNRFYARNQDKDPWPDYNPGFMSRQEAGDYEDSDYDFGAFDGMGW